jgi:choline kinase
MRIIIIAAGSSTRLEDYSDAPKGLLKIKNDSIVRIQLNMFRNKNYNDIIIITGPNKEKFDFNDVLYIRDTNHKKHDVLGSLMAARDYLYDEILTTYSDIIFEEKILKSMTEFSGDIGIAVDLDWGKNYINRDQHTKSQADNVLVNGDEILQIRKNILECKKNEKIGEFLGLMKLSKKGSKIFLERYSELEMKHKGKFHNASSLEKAYLTDMLQELIDSGIRISPIYISGKWCEIDTLQDLEIAKKLFS